jgi:hypothetical protein
MRTPGVVGVRAIIEVIAGRMRVGDVLAWTGADVIMSG